jgi:hypothetical protein
MNLTREQILMNLREIGLLQNDKPVSLSEFKKAGTLHVYKGIYTSRKSTLKIIFFGHPKQNLFGFYPPQTTVAESWKIAYQYFLNIVTNEAMEDFCDRNVMWGNRGIPISYGALRVAY